MLPLDSQRPDPDDLLAQVQAQEKKAARGHLRIYFGASAGVGKTYAMLAAARKLQAEGRQPLVGIVETHGRSDTAAMLESLEVLPLKQVAYRGANLPEFDLDEALARKPELVLVDELAHSNAAGSRHPKRWQDVEELLEAGINVFTTVNVQHLESLNDVVGGITGIRVAETLPDKVFDRADEVVLVDVPADELLARLRLGKVYRAAQAEQAARNFFRKGNLIALRELALRRTADRIQDDVQAYRIEKSISPLWKTGAVLLACVGPRPGAEHVVRSAARMAGQLNAEWHAVYVETPSLQRLSAPRRERILQALKLAQELGATTAVLTGDDIAASLAAYAGSQNISKLILGRASTHYFWRDPHSRRIAALAPEADLIEVGEPPFQPGEKATVAPLAESGALPGERRLSRYHRYVLAAMASTVLGVFVLPLEAWLDLTNIAMLFLLMVLLVAFKLGRGPAALASVIGVASFDFLFVPPRFSFSVSDFQYLITFGAMLAVGLLTGHLAAGLRFQARVSTHREARARALYEFARELTGVLQTEQIFDITQRFLQRSFRAKVTLMLPDADGRLQVAPDADVDAGIAQWAFDHAELAGLGTGTLPSSPVFYLPLIAPMRTRGVLALQPQDRRWLLIPEQRRQLDTFAALAAIALERVHYIEVAQGALVQIESERLRNSLLAALSHDLRTPLTSLVGLAESLAMSKPALAPDQLDLARSLQEETLRMSALVANLLDMARIESGAVKLNLQWQSLEEVVGSALRASRHLLAQHHVATRLPAALPLVQYDAMLIERVLCNLLENAAKYTPAGSTIVIAAELPGGQPPQIAVSVRDDGPGLPPGQETAIFEKFTRGERESARPGIGLGLAICRAIIHAHGGSIGAGRAEEGGAAITFTLPLGTPPAMPEESEL
jgi:two-component system sensor histidine kinase KdpD